MISLRQHIPNALTCCNLLSGCIATSFAFDGDINTAFLFIILGSVFDFFDGMVARLLHVSSPTGKELDSLADNITFGVAPSMMVFYELKQLNCPAFLELFKVIFPYTAFLIAAFSALRLAKFNIDKRQSMSFIGLPTPANALFWGGLLMLKSKYQNTPAFYIIILLLVFLSSYLLISDIPMFSLKFNNLNWKDNKFCLFFLSIAALLLILFSLPAFAIIITWYIILSYIRKKP